MIARNLGVSTSIFIDDLTLDGQGAKGDVIENVTEAAQDLIEVYEVDLKMPISLTLAQTIPLSSNMTT